MISADLRDPSLAMTSSDDEQKRAEQSYFRYIGTGAEYAATLLVLTLAGMWLDGRLGTSPVLTIVLAFVGFAAATWNLVRSVLRSNEPPHDRNTPQ